MPLELLMPDVVIMSNFSDTHALAVMIGLRRLGCSPYLWAPSDLPDFAKATISFDGGKGCPQVHLRHSGEEICLSDSRVFWHRRFARPMAPESASKFDVPAIESEALAHANNVIQILAERCFTVNDPAHTIKANCKALQVSAALNVGFAVPGTVISNDYDQVAAFRANRDGVVAKNYRVQGWMPADHKMVSSHTFELPALTEEDRWSIEACPLIVQERIVREFEARVIAFGDNLFAARVAGSSGELDSRFETTINGFDLMQPVEVPSAIRDGCVAYLKRLSLAFGAFDFIVDSEGKWWFLECNEAGQWLYLEQYAPEIELLDAFCRWLAKRAGVERDVSQETLHFWEVVESSEFRDLNSRTKHKQAQLAFLPTSEFETGAANHA
jgi:glutathione synthase/RimK-type ligase-like ATP-grasp enzyme